MKLGSYIYIIVALASRIRIIITFVAEQFYECPISN